MKTESSVEWNTLMFYSESEGVCKVDMMQITPNELFESSDNKQVAGVELHDRIRCSIFHVINKNGKLIVEEPFTTHLFDPMEYAKHMIHSNIMGMLVKDHIPYMKDFLLAIHTIITEMIDGNTFTSINEIIKGNNI